MIEMLQVCEPNDCGVLEGRREVVAQLGRSFAAVNIALAGDCLYRYGIDLMYSYGGFGFPINEETEAYATANDARNAGLHALLRRWPKPFPSDPASVVKELSLLRELVEAKCRQPSLF